MYRDNYAHEIRTASCWAIPVWGLLIAIFFIFGGPTWLSSRGITVPQTTGDWVIVIFLLMIVLHIAIRCIGFICVLVVYAGLALYVIGQELFSRKRSLRIEREHWSLGESAMKTMRKR